MAAAFSLGGSLLEAEDVLEAVIEKMHAAALCQLKAASVAWGAHVRRELCKRLWVRLCQREGQPEPAGVDSITDLDVECLNGAGRPWEAVVAGRKLPQLARLHGYGFVVDVQAVRMANLYYESVFANRPLGGTALRSCIQDQQQALAVLQQSVQQDETAEMTFEQKVQLGGGINALSSNNLFKVWRLIRENMPTLGAGQEEIEIDLNALDNRTLWKLHNFVQTCNGERQPPDELLLAAVACAASGTVREVPVQLLRSCAIDEFDLSDGFSAIGVTAATLLGLMLPAATSLRSLNLRSNRLGPKGVAALAKGLKRNSTLQSLDLSGNELGPNGGTALAEGLRGNTTLQSLKCTPPGARTGPKRSLLYQRSLTLLSFPWQLG
jgi:hypothetical protein